MDVELRPMAGTGERLLRGVEGSFAQRAAVMRADVVEGVPMTRGVDQYDQPITDFDQFLAWIGDVCDAGDCRAWITPAGGGVWRTADILAATIPEWF